MGAESNNYGSTRQRLLDNGYEPIPCDGKRPRLPDWQNRVGVDGYEKANVGLLTRHNPALDIDIDDAATAAAIRTILHERGAPERRGKGAKSLYLFSLAGETFKKLRREYRRGDQFGAVEVLADGQQAVAFGVHPETKGPYRWLGASPLTAPRDTLPTLDAAGARELLDQIENLLLALGWERVQRAGSGSMVRREQPLRALPDYQPSEEEQAAVKALLNLDAEGYDGWIAAGMALKAEGLPFELWDAWSRTAPNYDADACIKRWDSFEPHSAGMYNLYRAAGLGTAVLDFEIEPGAYIPPPPPARKTIADIIAGWKPRSEADFLIEPPIEWTVELLIQQGQVGTIQSPGGTGKSSLSLYLHACIAAGVPFLGYRVREGRTFYLSADDTQDDLDGALAAVVKAHEELLPHVEKIRERVMLISLRDQVELLNTSLVEAADGASKFMLASKFARELFDALAACGAFVLGQFDTVRQFNSADSNDEAAAKAFMAACYRFTLLKGKPAILLPHHVSKAVGRSKTNDAYAASGSNAYSDNARFGFNLFELPHDDLLKEFTLAEGVELLIDSQYLRLTPTRGSLRVKRQPSIYLQRTGFRFERLDGSTKTPGQVADELERKILDFARRHFSSGGKTLSQNAVEVGVGGKVTATRDAFRRLKARGAFVVEGGKVVGVADSINDPEGEQE